MFALYSSSDKFYQAFRLKNELVVTFSCTVAVTDNKFKFKNLLYFKTTINFPQFLSNKIKGCFIVNNCNGFNTYYYP